jgi:hypothetical protein
VTVSPRNQVWTLALALVGVAACAGVGTSDRSRATPELRSVVDALRDLGTLEDVETRDREWLRDVGGWQDEDVRELGIRLGSAFVGDLDGDKEAPDETTPPGYVKWEMPEVKVWEEMERLERAAAARERNALLADLIQRGDIDGVRRRLREWHRLRERARRDDF